MTLGHVTRNCRAPVQFAHFSTRFRIRPFWTQPMYQTFTIYRYCVSHCFSSNLLTNSLGCLPFAVLVTTAFINIYLKWYRNSSRVTVTPSKEWFKISESFVSHTLKLLQLPAQLVLDNWLAVARGTTANFRPANVFSLGIYKISRIPSCALRESDRKFTKIGR